MTTQTESANAALLATDGTWDAGPVHSHLAFEIDHLGLTRSVTQRCRLPQTRWASRPPAASSSAARFRAGELRAAS